jgi:hypothetical protein
MIKTNAVAATTTKSTVIPSPPAFPAGVSGDPGRKVADLCRSISDLAEESPVNGS